MANLHHHYSLKAYNTFGIEVYARRFAAVTRLNELQSLLTENYPVRLLGGGSNLLLTQDIDALVLYNDLHGIEVVQEDSDHVWIKAQAGENWHQLVLWCIEKGYAGIENLSLIPGKVGAAPIQNIGAYGVELKDVFYELEAIHLQTKEVRTFSKGDCQFGYRDSVFKKELKGQYFIVSVTLQLYKNPHFNTSYGAIQKVLNGQPLTLRNLSNAVIQIRQSKLPDPQKIGNSGSFFKNPIIPQVQYKQLLDRYPELPSYPVEAAEMVKVPAGWLIDQAGWKGHRRGDAGVHSQQALVLVNHGRASGQEIWQLAQDIQQNIEEKYGIRLQPEVNVW